MPFWKSTVDTSSQSMREKEEDLEALRDKATKLMNTFVSIVTTFTDLSGKLSNRVSVMENKMDFQDRYNGIGLKNHNNRSLRVKALEKKLKKVVSL